MGRDRSLYIRYLKGTHFYGRLVSYLQILDLPKKFLATKTLAYFASASLRRKTVSLTLRSSVLRLPNYGFYLCIFVDRWKAEGLR
jgi:hypothetical protein